MTRRVIFNADDYGLSPGVSAGILAAAEGVVGSTTVMANLVSQLEADFLRRSGVSVGAHLTMTVGLPLSDEYPEELRGPYGGFNKELALDAATWRDDARREAVEREWRAQLRRLRELGFELDHLDSHHHAHLLGPLLPIAVQLARERGLALRTRPAKVSPVRRAGVLTPDLLIEGYFGITNVGMDHLLALLDAADGDVVEVMCHPGRVDGLLKLRSGYVAEREAELDVLSDPRLKQEVRQRGWILSGYRW